MNYRHASIRTSIKLFLLAALSPIAMAQSSATATQALQLSAFGGITGTYIEIEGGRNAGITAGADLTFNNLSYHFKPSIEIRGTYPIDDGTIASEKNFMGGLKVEYPIRKFHPYGDVFVGQGEIDYQNGGFQVSAPTPPYPPFTTLNYVSSTSLIYSPGGGLDYDITPRFAIKLDFQFQHWDVPVVTSGSNWARAGTVGVVYTFNFNPRHHSHY